MNMHVRYLIAGIGALCLTAGAAMAKPELSIRLVEASNTGQGVSRGLEDVSQMLKDNLPFNTFRLLSTRSMPIPASGEVALAEGISARCAGDARGLRVIIEQSGRVQLQSTVALRKDTALILGGFPSARPNARMIVILMLKE